MLYKFVYYIFSIDQLDDVISFVKFCLGESSNKNPLFIK